VDPAALLAVVDRMSEFDQELEGHLAHAASSVAQLATSWYGDGGEAERSAQRRWNQGASEMREALARLRQIAEGAHENYCLDGGRAHREHPDAAAGGL
jgi:WXG100 family type VII secretion target